MTTPTVKTTPNASDALAYAITYARETIDVIADEIPRDVDYKYDQDSSIGVALTILDNLRDELAVLIRPFMGGRPIPGDFPPGFPNVPLEALADWKVSVPRYSDGSPPYTDEEISLGTTWRHWHRPPGYPPLPVRPLAQIAHLAVVPDPTDAPAQIDDDEAARRIAIARSLLNHRKPTARTLEIARLAFEGADIDDLAGIERLERDEDGPDR